MSKQTWVKSVKINLGGFVSLFPTPFASRSQSDQLPRLMIYPIVSWNPSNGPPFQLHYEIAPLCSFTFSTRNWWLYVPYASKSMLLRYRTRDPSMQNEAYLRHEIVYSQANTCTCLHMHMQTYASTMLAYTSMIQKYSVW